MLKSKPASVTGPWDLTADVTELGQIADKWYDIEARFTDEDTVTDFKEYLRSQYLAGTPVIVVYTLAETATVSEATSLSCGSRIMNFTCDTHFVTSAVMSAVPSAEAITLTSSILFLSLENTYVSRAIPVILQKS